ncbi:hypothetical protein RUMGNA_03068 [Mediterraneibacter gnavus ATCC 29149]|uniref:Uncharacterized protein n=1 Tax=Mediterraneibacter gnavus (strain ATCC 29149 / DSM 114966 / JCM 6515 / VPI C7-9) TaxID=411470 RepID=A7B657_MEDG7|nr:hypothetical protein RUMGNA_03068 [Mediterraneibacter gnavus ATCC 29149]
MSIPLCTVITGETAFVKQFHRFTMQSSTVYNNSNIFT